MSILFLALLFVGQDEPLEKLIEGWKQDNPAAREKASKQIVRLWRSLKDVELEKLRELTRSSDREVAARALEVLKTIEFRRAFGEALSAKIEKAAALLEEQRTSGAPARIVAWGMPGGPMFNLSPQIKQLIELGPEIEPFLRPGLADPALRNEVAIILSYLGSVDSVPALIDQLPTKDLPLVGGEPLTFTCVVNTLYEITGAAIGMNSREQEPYSPEIRMRWKRWYDRYKDHLYTPPGPAPQANVHTGPRVELDVEAWAMGVPTGEYRKTHPWISYPEIAEGKEGAESERRLREYCIQLLFRRLWWCSTWKDDVMLVMGDVDEPRCLSVLRKIAVQEDLQDFTANRLGWALRRKGAAVLPDLEKLVGTRKGQEARYLILPLAWARVDQQFGKVFTSRVESNEALLLWNCGSKEDSRRNLVQRLGDPQVSLGMVEIAGFVPDDDVKKALQAIVDTGTREDLRVAAAVALGRLKDSDAATFLRSRLESDEPSIRLVAAGGLWKLGSREGLKTLHALLELRPLEDGREPSTVRSFTPPSRKSSLHIVRTACEILGEMGDPSSVEPIRKLLGENLNGFLGKGPGAVGTGWWGRPDVVALAKLGDLSGVDLIVKSARAGDPLGTAGTHDHLGEFQEIGIKKYARELIPLLKQPDWTLESDLYAARTVIYLLDKGR